MNKTGIAISASTLSIALCLSFNHFILERKTVIKIHKLEYPLILSSDQPSEGYHMLPKGTVLYFDKSYPEGFTRYKIYVNIDRMPLRLDDLSDPTEINPIEAAAPNKEDLIKLLQDYPLTKYDLESILKSKRISKEEIREILEKFSQ